VTGGPCSRRSTHAAARCSPAGEQLAAPRALAPAQIGALLAEARAEGAPATPALAVGDGALRYRTDLEAAGAAVAPEHSPLHLLRAVAVCELGRSADPLLAGELVPDYLRRPDAELALEGAGGTQP